MATSDDRAKAEPGSDPPRLDARGHRNHRRLLIGVTGSIGAAFMPTTVLWLRTQSCFQEIDLVVSKSATDFVSTVALQAFAGGRLVVDSDTPLITGEPHHVTMTMATDLFLVMPATANILGKAANGIADDLVSSCIVAAPCPVVFVPCMKGDMWNKQAVQRNIKTLQTDGYHVIEPVKGFSVASGQVEHGAMPHIEDLYPFLLNLES